MPKTNNKQNKRFNLQKELTEKFNYHYIFLKVIVSNIRDAFSANHFIQQINVLQNNPQYKEKNFLAYID